MNVFYLHNDPELCARYHVDKHVVKMITEYNQLLSTAHRVLDGTLYTCLTKNNRKIKRWRLDDKEKEALFYKASHVMHPSAVWVRKSDSNYFWLWNVLECLHTEYEYRYGRIHKGKELLMDLCNSPRNIHIGSFTEPTPAMPDEYKKDSSLESYREYYRKGKAHLHSWKNREIPPWIFLPTK